MEPQEYSWLLVFAFIVAFADAFAIGANDVANAFANSVGSRSLTLKQAACIACFTEALGALLLGKGVADTIKGKIIDPMFFADKPEVLMLGMTCAMVGSSTWVLIATFWSLPVSTTHSIVGAVVGVGVAAGGSRSVLWGWEGLGQIVASWFISPVLAGVVASLFYIVLKKTVLTQENAFERAQRFVPAYFFLTFFVCTFFITFKGAGVDVNDFRSVILISLGVSVLMALVAAFYFVPKMVEKINLSQPIKSVDSEETSGTAYETIKIISKSEEEVFEQAGTVTTLEESPSGTGIFSSLEVDVVSASTQEQIDMHMAADTFDEKSERMFSFLQVLTACFQSFAHGANDLANALGPLATVYFIYNEAEVADNIPVHTWQVLYAAFALDLGLVLLGYKIMASLGSNMTKMSAARGFNINLGAMLTVLTASFLSLPVSTTHCITGATAGVALANGGGSKALNGKLLLQCFVGWIITVPFAACVAGMFFSLMAYSPKV